MGLIKAAVSAVSGSLASQWKDYIKCDDMDMNTLMVKVSAKDGLISKDSAIQVNPGQIAVIFDSGKILDATAEEGQYTFDQSTTPTFFAGQFGEVFKDMWARFTYNGTAPKEQAVFFINAKEIIEDTNIADRTVRRILKKLLDNNTIKTVGNGENDPNKKYRITE